MRLSTRLDSRGPLRLPGASSRRRTPGVAVRTVVMMTGLNHSYFDVMTLRKQLQKKRYQLSLRPMKTRVAGGCFAKEVVLLYFRLLKKELFD